MTVLTDAINRQIVDRFYAAIADGDAEAAANVIGDDVRWSISGPVDLLPYCGQRQGKQAVLDVILRQVPQILLERRFVRDVTMIEGDRAAILGRLYARHSGTKRAVTYRVAHFMRFKRGKLVDYVSVQDSFDAAEQVTGHRIGIAPDDGAPIDMTEGLVAV